MARLRQGNGAPAGIGRRAAPFPNGIGALPIDGDTMLTDDEHAPEIIETIDKSNVARFNQLTNKLVERAHVEAVITAASRLRINKSVQQIETKVSEAVGELVCRIPIGDFNFHRRQDGRTCWRDPGFLKWFRKQNPGAFFNLHLRGYVNGWSKPNADKLKTETLKSEGLVA